eukprot:s1099_g14.t1
MALWGDSGIASSAIGSIHHLVGDLISETEDALVVQLWPKGPKARVCGPFSIPRDSISVAFFGAKLIDRQGILTFQVQHQSDVLGHPRCTRADLSNLIEVCSGMGIATTGFAFAGMNTVVGNDRSIAMAGAFDELHPGVPFVIGDLGCHDTVKRIHQVHPRPASMFSGFSCQPFSSGGPQRGASDSRSQALQHTLEAGFMLRIPVLILECVKNAGTNRMVRRAIEEFRDQCGFFLTENNLCLGDMWCSKRDRWWAVLSAPFIGPVHLSPMPVCQFPGCVSEVLRGPMAMEDFELQQLVLQGEELGLFTRYCGNLRKLFLDRSNKAPTALHSWGSQVVSCRCGCRNSGFAPETLQSRGIYGILMPTFMLNFDDGQEHPVVRHPHPLEVCLLNCAPISKFPSDLRLGLAGVGQMASPAHAVWIGAHVQKQLDLVHYGESHVDPCHMLFQLKSEVLRLADLMPIAQPPASHENRVEQHVQTPAASSSVLADLGSTAVHDMPQVSVGDDLNHTSRVASEAGSMSPVGSVVTAFQAGISEHDMAGSTHGSSVPRVASEAGNPSSEVRTVVRVASEAGVGVDPLADTPVLEVDHLSRVASEVPRGFHASDMPSEVPVPVDLLLSDCPPWVGFGHLGGAFDVTVIEAEDPVPVLVHLGSSQVCLFELLRARAQLVADCGESCSWTVIDCGTGLSLAGDDVISGKCLWIEIAVPCPMDLEPPCGIFPTVPFTVAETTDVEACAEDTDIPMDPPEAITAWDRPVCRGLDVPLDPLASLDQDQLKQVTPPRVQEVGVVHALRQQTISTTARLQTLENQGTLWADDEILYHLDYMLKESRKQWAVLDPLIAREGIIRPCSRLISQWLAQLGFTPTALVGVVPVEGHWIPFVWSWSPELLRASSWDGPGSPARCLSMLHDSVAKAVGASTFSVHLVHRSFAVDRLRGLCAVRFLDHMIRGRMLPTTEAEAVELHNKGRAIFVDFLDCTTDVPRPWVWADGLDSQATDRLHALLKQHGVPDDQVTHRSFLLIQAIGLPATQKALTSTQPWRGLKACANKVSPTFQIVLPQELEQVVKDRAMNGGVKGRKNKVKKAAAKPIKAQAPAKLDPTKLQLEEGLFTSSQGKELSQIGLDRLGPFAEGVILATPEEIAVYLKAGSVVSSGALGVVVLNGDSSSWNTSLTWATVRVVVRCQINGEPMIVPAILVQLGQIAVCSAPAKTMDALPQVDAACCKVSVYRDHVADWGVFCQAPIRYVLAHLAPLQVCSDSQVGQACSCLKWHSQPDSVIEDPVLDIWRRQWVNLSFKTTSPEHAEIFLVNIRFAGSQLPLLLGLSGKFGIFLEPRSLDARDPLMDYQVLWLAKTPIEELVRLQQCNPQILGLARLGSRLGVRVAVADAPATAGT